ncbi:MAG TPA: GGDEF domain-containing protein [Candidatus Limiplasma sp.]|nr:GGDEF domain-containing protein [Candidatus Limiplasma sp.]HRX07821.1 GGDEF domain-containing protein [Candidatus Limiplasma sp.]
MKTIEAFLREDGILRSVAITGADKPDIDSAMIARWQRLFSLMAKELREPTAMILRLTNDTIRVLFRGEPKIKDGTEYYFGNGLYCESILGGGALLVTAVHSDENDYVHQAKLAPVFTCSGLPIFWPDQELYAAICVPRKVKKGLNKSYQTIVSDLKEAFEQELAFVYQQQLLLQTAETDPLTQIFNRRKIDSILKTEFDRARRYGSEFSVTMMDLNSFKQVNDVYGHDAGDAMLKAFVKSLGAKLRETDLLGRWGGDEFLLICPHTDQDNTQQMMDRIRPSVNKDLAAMPAFSGFSYGVTQYEPADASFQAIVKRADEKMYAHKMETKKLKDTIA